jgi:hypothetical protein
MAAGQSEVAAAGFVEHRDATVLHGDDSRSSHLAVVPVEVLNLLPGVQLSARLHDAPRVGQQLFDDPAELVQLGAAGHRQFFEELDAHGPILPTRSRAGLQAASFMSRGFAGSARS